MTGWVRVAGVIAVAASLVGMTACIGGWQRARRRDTVASYHRFLREHPDSRHASKAQERLDYLRLKSHPTLGAFEEFELKFPESDLLPELRIRVEPLYFEKAREGNSSQAYAEFLRRYPDGTLTDRARGNKKYLEAVKHAATEQNLDWFVSAHPESEFVPGARQSLELADLRRRAGIEALGVMVRVGPGVTKPERIRRGFAGVVREAYAEHGVNTYLIADGTGIPDDIDAWMRIEYNEVPAPGVFGNRTLVSHCRVRLYHRGQSEPVWDRIFEAPADNSERSGQGGDPTVFGNSRYRFWEEFFVPIATWPTSRSRVLRKEFPDPIAGVGTYGDRVAVQLRDGSLEYLDLANPVEPKDLSRYRHQRDLTHWSGVVLGGPALAVSYGPDGAQMIDLRQAKGVRVARWEPLDVGSVKGGIRNGSTVLLAGNRGLYAVRTLRRPPSIHRLTDEPLVGVASKDEYVYLVSPTAISTLRGADLARWSADGNWTSAPALSRLEFSEQFLPSRAHQVQDRLYVLSDDAVLELSLENPKKPKALAQFEPGVFGSIGDLVTLGTRVFVVGHRGLEIAERRGPWILDTIQVSAHDRIEPQGRFLVLTGGNSMEVLDMTPYEPGAVPAKAARR